MTGSKCTYVHAHWAEIASPKHGPEGVSTTAFIGRAGVPLFRVTVEPRACPVRRGQEMICGVGARFLIGFEARRKLRRSLLAIPDAEVRER